MTMVVSACWRRLCGGGAVEEVGAADRAAGAAAGAEVGAAPPVQNDSIALSAIVAPVLARVGR